MAVSQPPFPGAAVASRAGAAPACPHGGAAILRRGWKRSGQVRAAEPRGKPEWAGARQGLGLWDEGFRDGQVPCPSVRAVHGQSSWQDKGPPVCFHLL